MTTEPKPAEPPAFALSELAVPPDGHVGHGIRVRGVRRTFGDVVAVDHLDLDAPPGQVTALVGPNGAGKTTLMLVLATLLVPDAGEVSVAGFDPVTELGRVRAAMGWMPDTFGFYETLTVIEVLRFMAAAYRLPRDFHDRRARDLLAMFHLAEFADRPVHVLSKGQKQRLGLARALVHDPAVLILDEPAAGLDPRSRIELRATIRGLAAEGRTVLVSSHILGELEEMADRVVLVDRGRTVDQRSMADLGQEPRDAPRPWLLHAIDPDEHRGGEGAKTVAFGNAADEHRGGEGAETVAFGNAADEHRGGEGARSEVIGSGDAHLVEALDRRGVPHGEPGPAGVTVLISTEQDAAALVSALVTDGVALVSFAPVGGALEAAYLAMTEERR